MSEKSDCPLCHGLLGPLPPRRRIHELCAWAEPQDWAALRGWLDGSMMGVTMSGA